MSDPTQEQINREWAGMCIVPPFPEMSIGAHRASLLRATLNEEHAPFHIVMGNFHLLGKVGDKVKLHVKTTNVAFDGILLFAGKTTSLTIPPHSEVNIFSGDILPEDTEILLSFEEQSFSIKIVF